jgi:hypothetical protein
MDIKVWFLFITLNESWGFFISKKNGAFVRTVLILIG